MPCQERCPFCDVLVSGNWFGKHLFRHHQDQLFINGYGGGNLQRLLDKAQNKPFEMRVGKNMTTYWTCLHCEHTSKRHPFIQRHFPNCQEEHNKKSKELYKKYSNHKEELTTEVVQPIVVEGYTEEQVFALIGSMMAHIKSSQREETDFKKKYEYVDEKIKDLCSEEVLDEIEESLPEYPEDDDIEFYQPEDITFLTNLSEKMGLHITNKKVEEAYSKWNKMPIKKRKAK